MPATQLSFAEFARSLSEAFFPAAPAAVPSTPPVQQTAVEVVAHPVAVDGGECLRFDGALLPFRGVGYSCLRADYDWRDAHASGDTMDAPEWLPCGSHRSQNLYGSCVVASSNRWLREL